MDEITVCVSGRQIGRLVVREDGVIDKVWVEPEWRRKGVGRFMWSLANEAGLRPCHSRNITEEGLAWARAVGGHIPEQIVINRPR
jgi:GNAT superfamily N-acetyltransferase